MLYKTDARAGKNKVRRHGHDRTWGRIRCKHETSHANSSFHEPEKWATITKKTSKNDALLCQFLSDGLHRVNTLSVSCHLALSLLCVCVCVWEIMQTVNKNQALLQTLQHNGCFRMPWLDQSQEANSAIWILLCSSTYITSLKFSVSSLSDRLLLIPSRLPEHPIISQLLNALHHCWMVTTEN